MFNPKLTILLALPLFLAACNIDSQGENTATTHTRQLEEICDLVAGCESGLICEEGICRKVCVSKDNCPANYTCENSRCRKVLDVLGNCGDGVEDPGESCDDGNERSGDGCSSKCNVENNYVCKGWPSKCQCAAGFQDSNSDGFCLSDCEPCGENKVCSYNAEGSAAGCVCAQGFQDSNKDGTCLPDCTSCDASQECRYKADGSTEGCFCPDGTQDNDGDGVCNPTCESKLAKDGACPAAMACYDEDGTADCECTYFVKAGVTAGSGRSWGDAEATIAGAVEKASQQIKDGTADKCSIWLKEGEHFVDSPVTLNNISIYGQFKGNETLLSARTGLDTLKTYIKSSIGKRIEHLFVVTGNVHLGDFAVENYTADSFDNTSDGGLINVSNQASLMLDNCRFANITYNMEVSKQYNCGLILHISDSRATINNCLFNNVNAHASLGGSIYSENSDLTVNDSTFVYNQAFSGGAIYSQVDGENGKTGSLVVKNSSFSNNIAIPAGRTALGGAIYNALSSMYIDKSMFAMNESSRGGAIWNSGPAMVSNVQFYANYIKPVMNRGGAYTDSLGGCIYNAGVMTLSNGIFSSTRVEEISYEGTTNQYYLSTGVHVYNDEHGTMEIGYVYSDGGYSRSGTGFVKTALYSDSKVDVNEKNEVIYTYTDYNNIEGSDEPQKITVSKKLGYKNEYNYDDNIISIKAYAFDSANDNTLKVYNSIICGTTLLVPEPMFDSSSFPSGVNYNKYYCDFSLLDLTLNYGDTEYGYSFDSDAYGFDSKEFSGKEGNTVVKVKHDSAKATFPFAGTQALDVSAQMLPGALLLPIIKADGENIWLPGDFGYSSLISRDQDNQDRYSSLYNKYLKSNVHVNVIDYYNALRMFDRNTHTNVEAETFVSARADINKGPQVTTDIFGKPRKNVPDIGPFEF